MTPPREKKLGGYRAKRDLDATPEPSVGGRSEGAGEGRFVVQEHHARSLHWDLRLERDGVLVSWAVPKGIPLDSKHNHLAVHVEDHPLEYLDFHGEIPAGNYGAGIVKIWDRGTYEAEKFRADEVIVRLHGERVSGRYALFRTDRRGRSQGGDGENWMIHRMDPPQDPEREPMPEQLEPMLAHRGELPAEADGWAFEVKWDGVRALAFVEAGRARMCGRRGVVLTGRYPEMRALGPALGSREAILDGELAAFDGAGRPSFQLLQRRMHLDSPSVVRRVATQIPVVYVIFDLLYLDGRLLLDSPYSERRAALEQLGLAGGAWTIPARNVGDGAALLAATREQGLEGVVAKQLDSRYLPGRRSRAWVKVKNAQRETLVIGGWLAGEGTRSGRLGALAVGRPEDGELRYVGRVGTGFDESELRRLGELLAPLERAGSPFAGRGGPKGAHWVTPSLRAEVEYTERTSSGLLRHPIYRGLHES
ncbi:MAG: non-homologous end-joining DNA ligase [Solirubrobacteraceae bacterium]|nr:MAG: DNA ligase [Solirubrobacterales bacterium]